MSQYPHVMAAAAAAGNARFALAAALAQDIPAGTPGPDVARHVHAVAYDIRQAGHGSYEAETLQLYRLMALHYAAAGFDQSKSFYSHVQAFKAERAERNQAERLAAYEARQAEQAARLAEDAAKLDAHEAARKDEPIRFYVPRNVPVPSLARNEDEFVAESITRHAEQQAARLDRQAEQERRDNAALGAQAAAILDALDSRKVTHANGQQAERVPIDNAYRALKAYADALRRDYQALMAATPGQYDVKARAAALYASIGQEIFGAELAEL